MSETMAENTNRIVSLEFDALDIWYTAWFRILIRFVFVLFSGLTGARWDFDGDKA